MCMLASVCAGDIPLEGVCDFVGLNMSRGLALYTGVMHDVLCSLLCQ